MQAGITLIALVISIIVMLILAGVSINAIVGENGILTKTQYATFLNEMAAVEEAVQIWKAGEAIGNNGETTAIPTNGMCKVNDLTSTDRLSGEVGYYRIWSMTETQPTTNILSSASDFNNVFESELIFYPAGVQDLYYLNNEACGIESKKTYLIDAATGMIYSMSGINLKGVSCYSSNMAKAVMNGTATVPNFAAAEVSGTGNGDRFAGNVQDEYLPNGEKNPDYNPYGFKFITSNTSDNIYKLYNNGDLYGKGKISLGLDSSSKELDGVDSYKFKEFNIPNEIGEYKKIITGVYTIFFIDSADRLWAIGDNLSNKLGLSEEQSKEYTGRSPIKISIQDKGEEIKVSNVFSFEYNTFVISDKNEVFVSGKNITNDNRSLGVIGFKNQETIDTFTKILELPTTSKVKKITIDYKYGIQYQTIILYEDGNAYIAGTINGGKNYFNQIINNSTFEGKKVIDIDNLGQGNGESKRFYILFNDGTVYKSTLNYNNTELWENTTQISQLNNIKEIYCSSMDFPMVCIDENNKFYMYNYLERFAKYIGETDATYSEDAVVSVEELFPEKIFEGNDKVIDIIQERSAGVYVIMESGNVWGAGSPTYLGLPSYKSMNQINELKLICDSNGVQGESNLNQVKIIGTRNSKIQNSGRIFYPVTLVDKNSKIYMTSHQGLMYGDNILQKNWKLIASNVKDAMCGGSNQLAIIDENNDAYIILNDYRDIGVKSISENIELGNNFHKIITAGVANNVKEVYFSSRSIQVLTIDGNLYSAGRARAGGWYWPPYLGIDTTEAIEELTLIDSGVKYCMSQDGEEPGDKVFYVKNDKLYFFGWNDGTLPGINLRCYTPVEVNLDNLEASKIRQIFPDWNYQVTVLDDGNVVATGGYVNKYCNGFAIFSDLGFDDKVVSFTGLFNCPSGIFLCESGNVYGYGLSDKLGLNKNSSSLTDNIEKLNLEDIDSIHSIRDAYIVVSKSGKVYGTGSNVYGVLGRWIGVGRGDSNSRYKTALNWVECPELEI